MTSVLNVDTIADKAGTGPVALTKQSAAKAWINFNGSTFATNDSFGIASNVDNGTGDYTVTVTNAFDSANYATAVNANSNNDGWFARVKSSGGTSAAPSTYTSTAVNFTFAGGGASPADTSLFTAAYFGDLA